MHTHRTIEMVTESFRTENYTHFKQPACTSTYLRDTSEVEGKEEQRIRMAKQEHSKSCPASGYRQ